MITISSILGQSPATGAAQNQSQHQGNTAVRAGASIPLSANLPNTQAAAQASVVTLTSSSKSRGATSGENRLVDSAFEKEEIEGEGKGKKGESKSRAVDIKA